MPRDARYRDMYHIWCPSCSTGCRDTRLSIPTPWGKCVCTLYMPRWCGSGHLDHPGALHTIYIMEHGEMDRLQYPPLYHPISLSRPSRTLSGGLLKGSKGLSQGAHRLCMEGWIYLYIDVHHGDGMRCLHMMSRYIQMICTATRTCTRTYRVAVYRASDAQ